MKNIEIEAREKDNGEIFYYFKLSDGTIACVIKMLGYSLLEKIRTEETLRRKGYGTKLYEHVEEIAKRNCVKTLETTDIDPCDGRAVCFFWKMGFEFRHDEQDPRFIKGYKTLEPKTSWNFSRQPFQQPKITIL